MVRDLLSRLEEVRLVLGLIWVDRFVFLLDFVGCMDFRLAQGDILMRGESEYYSSFLKVVISSEGYQTNKLASIVPVRILFARSLGL